MLTFWLSALRLLRRGSVPLLLALSGPLVACGQQSDSPASSMSAYDQMLRLLYKQTVPLIQPVTLAAQLRAQPTTVLLDTRAPAEYRVSHLAGARLVDYATYRQLDLRGWSRTQPIVVYCSVGARSEQVGAWLREQGFQHVQNLYGGIFQWVNDGHPVVNSQGPTQRVHPYSVLWRPWLKKGEAAYE